MPLPVLESPKYEVKIPSTGKVVTYRPYLVKEEKILLIAMESEDQKQILQAMKDVIHSCTFGKLDVDKLAIFDIEYIFLKLRIKSVGETAKIGIKCEKCGMPVKVELELDKIQVSELPKSNKIKLTDKIGVLMRFPTVSQMKPEDKSRSKLDEGLEILRGCIESIYDDKGVYPADEQSPEELDQFIESLNSDQFLKLQEFVANMPKLEHKVKFTCRSITPPSTAPCGKENEITLSGIQSFFE